MTRFLKPGWQLHALAAAALILAGASTARADIKIGVFGPMTGDAAGYGQSLREAVDLVVKERNAAGGLLGQKIDVIYGDDAGKPEQAVSVAKRLTASDEVLIMLGSISSPASLAASQVAQQSETPQIVISGTAQRITTQGNKWVFRSAIPDTAFTADLVDFINEKFPGKKKVAFIYVNDDFGKGGFEGFRCYGDGLSRYFGSPNQAMELPRCNRLTTLIPPSTWPLSSVRQAGSSPPACLDPRSHTCIGSMAVIPPLYSL